MALITPPYANENASVTAQQVRLALNTAAGYPGPNSPNGGVFRPNNLVVSQAATPAMSVVVGPGHCWVVGDDVDYQGSYYVLNDADVTLGIEASDPTNPRYDIVAVVVADSEYAGDTNSATLVVITGTPAGSPSPPSLPDNALELALIAVPANATTITTGDIANTAPILALGGGFSGSLFGVGGTIHGSAPAAQNGGVLTQAGTTSGTTNSDGFIAVDFEDSFPNSQIAVLITAFDQAGGVVVNIGTVSGSGFSAHVYVGGTSLDTGAVEFSWLAIGS